MENNSIANDVLNMKKIQIQRFLLYTYIMRDKRLVTERRGGLLKKEQHRQLITWACECSEHILHLYGEKIDERLKNALAIAKEWERGNATVGDARKASVEAHAGARESSSPVSIAVARSVGHAVATAHMADHSIGASLYALKAVKLAGESVEKEREWQDNRLPLDLKEIVQEVRTIKLKGFKFLRSD